MFKILKIENSKYNMYLAATKFNLPFELNDSEFYKLITNNKLIRSTYTLYCEEITDKELFDLEDYINYSKNKFQIENVKI